MADSAGGCTWRLAGTITLLLLSGGIGRAAEDHRRLQMLPGLDRLIVAEAIEEAAHRLDRPDCAAVLRDFTDPSGRRLADTLAALELSATNYLALVWFVDASEHPLCGSQGTVAAFTQPGSRFVSICTSRFGKLPYSTRQFVVIHEALHTLGLGENPPSSAAITDQVIKRCQ